MCVGARCGGEYYGLSSCCILYPRLLLLTLRPTLDSAHSMASRDYSDSDSEVSQRRSPVKSRTDNDDDDSIMDDETPTNVDDELLMASESVDTSRVPTAGPSNSHTGERPPRSASSTSQNIRIKVCRLPWRGEEGI